MVSLTLRALLLAVVCSLAGAALQLAQGGGEQGVQAAREPGTVALLAIDADPTGNSIRSPVDTDSDTTADSERTTLGTIDECISIASPGTVEVDVVVQGYPSTDPLTAYSLALYYDRAAAEVKSVLTGEDPDSGRTLISADPQSGPLFPFSMGGMDGAYFISVVDRAPLDPDEDIDGGEASDGFLARFTLDVLAEGIIPLALGSNSSVGGDEGQLPVAEIRGAQIAVGEPCPSVATPTPGPSPTVGESPTPEPTSPAALTPTPETTATAALTPTPTLGAGVTVVGASPSPSPTVQPRLTVTPAPTGVTSPVAATASPEVREIEAPPPAGGESGGGGGSVLSWLPLGLALGGGAFLASAAVVWVRRRAR